jgi:hypothetical protein
LKPCPLYLSAGKGGLILDGFQLSCFSQSFFAVGLAFAYSFTVFQDQGKERGTAFLFPDFLCLRGAGLCSFASVFRCSEFRFWQMDGSMAGAG